MAVFSALIIVCCQDFSVVQMHEGDSMELDFSASSELLCPDCYVELKVTSHVGLTLSRCSLRFTDVSGNETLELRAVPTPGTNSRIVALRFSTVVSATSDSVWQGYRFSTIIMVTGRFSCYAD